MAPEDNQKNNNDSEVLEAKSRQLLAASALIPVLCALSQPANFKALIYTVFIINYLIKTRAKKEPTKVLVESQPTVKTSLSLWQKLEFIALFIACGMIVQTLDYLGHLSFPLQTGWSPSWICFAPPGPSVAWQFIMTFRVMVALSLAWLVALRFFVFSEIEFIKIAVGFGAVLTAMDYLPVISLPNIEAVIAGAICHGSIAGIAATPLALKETVQHHGKMGEKEIYLITTTLLFVAVKLVIYLTPIPALSGG